MTTNVALDHGTVTSAGAPGHGATRRPEGLREAQTTFEVVYFTCIASEFWISMRVVRSTLGCSRRLQKTVKCAGGERHHAAAQHDRVAVSERVPE